MGRRDISLVRSGQGVWGFTLATTQLAHRVGHQGKQLGHQVTEVVPKSISQKAGLKVNDLVLTINGTSLCVMSHQEAQDVMREAGDKVELVVDRDEAEMGQLPPGAPRTCLATPPGDKKLIQGVNHNKPPTGFHVTSFSKSTSEPRGDLLSKMSPSSDKFPQGFRSVKFSSLPHIKKTPPRSPASDQIVEFPAMSLPVESTLDLLPKSPLHKASPGLPVESTLDLPPISPLHRASPAIVVPSAEPPKHVTPAKDFHHKTQAPAKKEWQNQFIPPYQPSSNLTPQSPSRIKNFPSSFTKSCMEMETQEVSSLHTKLPWAVPSKPSKVGLVERSTSAWLGLNENPSPSLPELGQNIRPKESIPAESQPILNGHPEPSLTPVSQPILNSHPEPSLTSVSQPVLDVKPELSLPPISHPVPDFKPEASLPEGPEPILDVKPEVSLPPISHPFPDFDPEEPQPLSCESVLEVEPEESPTCQTIPDVKSEEVIPLASQTDIQITAETSLPSNVEPEKPFCYIKPEEFIQEAPKPILDDESELDGQAEICESVPNVDSVAPVPSSVKPEKPFCYIKPEEFPDADLGEPQCLVAEPILDSKPALIEEEQSKPVAESSQVVDPEPHLVNKPEIVLDTDQETTLPVDCVPNLDAESKPDVGSGLIVVDNPELLFVSTPDPSVDPTAVLQPEPVIIAGLEVMPPFGNATPVPPSLDTNSVQSSQPIAETDQSSQLIAETDQSSHFSEDTSKAMIESPKVQSVITDFFAPVTKKEEVDWLNKIDPASVPDQESVLALNEADPAHIAAPESNHINEPDSTDTVEPELSQLIEPQHPHLITPEPTLFTEPEADPEPNQAELETIVLSEREKTPIIVDLVPETSAFNIPFEMQQNIPLDQLEAVDKHEDIGVQFTSVTTKFWDSKLNITAKGFLSSQPQENFKCFRSVKAPKSKAIG